jgi:hypothetical protein
LQRSHLVILLPQLLRDVEASLVRVDDAELADLNWNRLARRKLGSKVSDLAGRNQAMTHVALLKHYAILLAVERRSFFFLFHNQSSRQERQQW